LERRTRRSAIDELRAATLTAWSERNHRLCSLLMCGGGCLRTAQSHRRQRKQQRTRRSATLPIIQPHGEGIGLVGVSDFGHLLAGIVS
jgi:hypothetical protein